MGLTYYGSSRAVIDAPGHYTIDRDLTQAHPSDACIYVNPAVHYVTIHLRGRLVGAGGPSSISSGIEANGSAALTVLNEGGSIRGFCYGVRAENCLLFRAEGVFVQDGWFRGIRVEGDHAMIKGCDIQRITGATWTPNAYGFGIEVSGSSRGFPKIIGNVVEDFRGVGTGEGVGISISDHGLNGIVAHNVVRNPEVYPKTFGVWIGGQSDVLVAQNIFERMENAVAFSTPPTGMLDGNTYRQNTHNIWDAGNDVIRSDADPDSQPAMEPVI